MLKVFTWSTYYFVPTPTLFWIWTWSTVYDNTFWSWKDLLPGVNNAAVFDSSKVYASTSSTWLSATEVESLMVTIQSAYLTWNVTTPAVQEVLAATWSALTDLWVWLVKNSLGWGAVASWGAWTWTVTPPTWAVFPWNWNTGSWFSFSWATPTSCADLLAWSTFKVWTTIPWNWSYFLSGSYLIDPDWAWAVPSKFIYCDMTSDWGGWTLLAVWWVRDSRYCSTTWFWSPSPASSYSVWTTYMPAPGTTRTYRNSIDWTTFSSGISILNTSNSNWCMILDQTGIGFKDPTWNWRVFLFNWNWEGCHWFYYGWSCDSYTNNWWLYVK
ncbi:MAG: hypothetical protein ACD_3C00045G0001 [uncultured bacterium (gcode 4)]|uniref:Uncharacterized protein n=1 Tax=uncultured bacterium (gcode 4) TaxID=1234023 RepID=K2GYP5_9BACT|nr:MAG: hypothetical protein ACD_3C00045G0001 [uncultured bacterium (gcode 4)]